MSDELTMAIMNLNIRYYQMRMSENTVRLFDERQKNNERKNARAALVECLELDQKLYDEQYEIVENLIKKENEN